jgi:hypothetical protein
VPSLRLGPDILAESDKDSNGGAEDSVRTFETPHLFLSLRLVGGEVRLYGGRICEDSECLRKSRAERIATQVRKASNYFFCNVMGGRSDDLQGRNANGGGNGGGRDGGGRCHGFERD